MGVTVRLLEQNEDYVAITDELLYGDIKIVTESDKELANGMAVKEWGTRKERERGDTCCKTYIYLIQY